jgi:hypothetical protein
MRLRKAAARSRVSNGGDILPGVDLRSATARRYRDLVALIAVDQGGIDRLSEARVQLIRRFAAAACLAENLEAQLASGAAIDITEHCALTSTLVRVAQRIGINRVPKNITPALADYLDNCAAANEDVAD